MMPSLKLLQGLRGLIHVGCGWGGCSRKQFESEKLEEEERLRGLKELVEEQQQAVEVEQKHVAFRTAECLARETALASKEAKVAELVMVQQADRAALERLDVHLKQSKKDIGEQQEDCAAAVRRLEEEKASVKQEWEKVQLRLKALDHREEELELRETALADQGADVAKVVASLQGREADAQWLTIQLVRHSRGWGLNALCLRADSQTSPWLHRVCGRRK